MPPPSRREEPQPQRNNGGGGGGGFGGGASSAGNAKKQGGLLNFQRSNRKAPAIGFILVVVGAFLWLVNAEYTAQGLVGFFNAFFNWFRIEIAFGRLVWYYSIPAGIIAGYFITQAQIREFPLEYVNGVVKWISWGAILGWAIVSLFDVVTTAQGFVILPDDAWPIHQQAANSLFATGLYSIALAFMPEAMIVAGWGLLGWPVPSFFKRK